MPSLAQKLYALPRVRISAHSLPIYLITVLIYFWTFITLWSCVAALLHSTRAIDLFTDRWTEFLAIALIVTLFIIPVLLIKSKVKTFFAGALVCLSSGITFLFVDQCVGCVKTIDLLVIRTYSKEDLIQYIFTQHAVQAQIRFGVGLFFLAVILGACTVIADLRQQLTATDERHQSST